MTSPAPLLAVVLLALLVGAAIPVLYQLYQVLKRVRALLDTAGPRLEDTLDQVGQAAERLNGIGSTLETRAETIRPLFEAVSRLGHWIDRSGEWLGTAVTAGRAVGPAVIAGLSAFFTAPRSGRGTGERLKSADFGPGTTPEHGPRAIRRTGTTTVKAGQAPFERGGDEMSDPAGHPSRRTP